MHKYTAVLALFAVLGTAATASWATPPGKNGQIVFRRYLDASRTTGALFTMNPEGTGVKQITRPAQGVIDQLADWSPDGRRVAFERRVPCPAGGPKDGLDNACTRIYTVGRDGKGLKPLVPCGFRANAAFPGNCVSVHAPAWSPEGSRIAFRYSLVDRAYAESLNVNAAIWIANANGTDPLQVTQRTPGSSWDIEPQWSPDGTKLVFVRVDLTRKLDAVFTVELDGDLFQVTQVTPWALNAGVEPDWSPDGNWIVFTAHQGDGSENVYKVHPDGTGLTNLTKQKAGGFHYLSSSFSPDGKLIISARTPGAGKAGHADLVVMRADGSRIRPITRTALWESSVDWGPRG
jgi:TolB protein